MTIKMCKFYKSSRLCTNDKVCINQYQLDIDMPIKCTSELYYRMDLENQLKQLKEENAKLKVGAIALAEGFRSVNKKLIDEFLEIIGRSSDEQ